MGTGARQSAHAVVLRIARLADIDAMVEIEASSFTDPWSRHALLSAIESPALSVVVAEAGAKVRTIVGYYVVARVADEAELLNLAVRHGARRQRIGSTLLERALVDAERWGARALFLEVRHSNSIARRLYVNAGFEQVGCRRGYYRQPTEDALILRKRLS